MKKVIETSNAPAPVGPYSQAIEMDGTLYCSGQIPIVPETGDILTGDVQEQTKQVMKNAEAVLKEADYSWGDVIKTTIFMTDLGDFAKMNEIYASYFGDQPPARSCVQVAALPKGVNVEVEILARKA
ncbi:MAG: RidA family protein [Bdellovibrionales bacterium]|nr:RidA family protein [Bdellovibrionales bacterium]NQZ17837.1 RidA family protein [Bdellovibrionales bacterium]